jgi:hypothetical protein
MFLFNNNQPGEHEFHTLWAHQPRSVCVPICFPLKSPRKYMMVPLPSAFSRFVDSYAPKDEQMLFRGGFATANEM